jgi:hypothetical protein
MIAAAAAIAVLAPSAAAASRLVEFSFDVNDLPPADPFLASYTNPNDVGLQGSLQQTGPGYIDQFALQSRGVFLLSSDLSAPLSATVDQWVQVSSNALRGNARVPAGATATLTNMTTDEQVTLTTGPYSIPTGLDVRGAFPPAGTKLIRCKGGPRACTATVPIAGGASNRKLIIKLTDTNLRLLSVTAVPVRSNGAYLLTGGRFMTGGSQYRVTLDAARANPKGSHLVMRFRAAN